MPSFAGPFTSKELPLIVLLLLSMLAIEPHVTATSGDRKPQTRPTDRLVELVRQGHFQAFLEELGQPGLDVNRPDSYGRMPLMAAVQARQLPCVQALLQHRARANITDGPTGTTPIALAFMFSLLQIARLLLEYGADINVVDKIGDRARDFAPTMEIHHMINRWDEHGAAGFESPPGSWHLAFDNAGRKYWHNQITSESRWSRPPSCCWTRDAWTNRHGEHTATYTNTLTGQRVSRLPDALAWRLVSHGGQDVWYNWRSHVSQLHQPHELPADMAIEAATAKDLRWFNPLTGEMSWEEPAMWLGLESLGEQAGVCCTVQDTETLRVNASCGWGNQSSADIALPVSLAWGAVRSPETVPAS